MAARMPWRPGVLQQQSSTNRDGEAVVSCARDERRDRAGRETKSSYAAEHRAALDMGTMPGRRGWSYDLHSLPTQSTVTQTRTAASQSPSARLQLSNGQHRLQSIASHLHLSIGYLRRRTKSQHNQYPRSAQPFAARQRHSQRADALVVAVGASRLTRGSSLDRLPASECRPAATHRLAPVDSGAEGAPGSPSAAQ